MMSRLDDKLRMSWVRSDADRGRCLKKNRWPSRRQATQARLPIPTRLRQHGRRGARNAEIEPEHEQHGERDVDRVTTICSASAVVRGGCR